MSMEKPLLVVVGGFLGAGKTTLIVCAASMLQRQSKRVAVITNDQGDELVDTRQARAVGLDAAEVGGGCFCCRFSDFTDAADRVSQYRPDVIFAEPVGSCTDIAATVLRPLQSHFSSRFRLAPFTVLVDPAIARRARESVDGAMRFLFDHQVREADLVCYSKADQYEYLPGIDEDEPLRVSAVTGEGVREWLELLSGWQGLAGGQSVDVDYDRYAAAEAALGWVNAHLETELKVPTSPSRVVGPLLEYLDEHLTRAGVPIVHLKVFDQTVSSYLKGGIVCNGQEPSVQGDLLAPAERRHALLLNLRGLAGPDLLRRVVSDALRTIPGRGKPRIQAFTPGYPRPESRISAPA